MYKNIYYGVVFLVIIVLFIVKVDSILLFLLNDDVGIF